MSRAASIWVVWADAACAVVLLALAIDAGLRDPWFLIYSGAMVSMIVGIILEARASRWSPLWNVGVFLALAAASLFGGSIVGLLVHRVGYYSEGSLFLFFFYGVPALVLAAINFLVFRRMRQVNARA